MLDVPPIDTRLSTGKRLHIGRRSSPQLRIWILVVLFIVGMVALGLSSIALSATLKVPADYPTIQGAINASKSGDVIMVAQGNYAENLTLKPNIRLEGGYKSDYSARNWMSWPSIIDGAQKGSVVIGADRATLDGFTLRNGKAALGAGLFLDRGSMTIKNNTIEDNVADSGGGGLCIQFGPQAPPFTDIELNTIRRNTVLGPHGGQGGGIFVVNSGNGIRITNNTIGGKLGDGNKAWGGGGGIAMESTSIFQIERNTISQNEGGKFHGGGVMIIEGTPNATLTQNEITFNSVYGNFGGGVYSIGGTTISRNNIAFNTIFNTQSWGGGIAVSAPGGTPPRIDNNFIHNNEADHGAGIHVDSGHDVIIVNNSISSNRPDTPNAGAGIHVKNRASCVMRNNILWGNGDDFHEEMVGSCTLDHNDIEDGDQAGQNGNISANPLFIAYDNLHIQKNSPVINQGNAAAVPPLDYDGDKRGAKPDVGADEIVSESEPTCPLVRSAKASYLEAYLGDVRHFRDSYLNTNSAGKAFVGWYYAQAPAASDFLAQHAWARDITRWLVTPVVLVIAYPEVALFALISLVGAMAQRRRKAIHRTYRANR